jgi:hypothetical protein
MPVPSQGHNGFHSFPVVDWFCLFIYLWVLIFPLEDCRILLIRMFCKTQNNIKIIGARNTLRCNVQKINEKLDDSVLKGETFELAISLSLKSIFPWRQDTLVSNQHQRNQFELQDIHCIYKRRIRKDGWCQRGNRTPLENQMFVRIFSFHYLIWCYNYLHSEYLIIPLIKWGAIVVVVVCKLELQLPVQTGPISTKVSSNLVHGEVYSIQHYVIKLVSAYVLCGHTY